MPCAPWPSKRRTREWLVPGLGADLPPTSALEVLDPRVVDDFTAADLREADLSVLDLTGVRWSPRGTRRPAVLDVTGPLARSEEDPPGSGLYVVRRPTELGAPGNVLL